MAKSVYLLIYDTFAEFEVTVLLTAMRGTKHTLTTVGLSPEPVTTTGRLTVLPEVAIDAVKPKAVDALIVPGGDASHAMGNEDLRALIQHLDAREALLAAICGGPAVLGDAGVLDDRRYTAALGPEDAAYTGIQGRGTPEPELLVTDGNVVTAVGSAYLSFAEEVLRHLDEGPVVEPLTYFREPSLA
ncbi:MAG: DJ-1/PfpI family protein [Intrasporangium sp.]|uniref:DJ-1/PfpI family protein n=1 Tax=Intrasporangium sp. TaxID=1925024 RepID=UPI003F81E5DB